MPEPVAIVGAGFIGCALARRLGPAAILAGRSGRPRHDVGPAVRTLALDVTDPALDPAPLAAARSLVLAYAPGAGGDRRALYVDGTRRLLEHLTAPLRRIVVLGSTSSLPDRDGWVFEDDDAPPPDERGAVQRDAEATALHHGDAHGVPTLVLRLGGLYGPGRELERIYRRRRDGALPGHGLVPTNLVHRDDVVAAIVGALTAPPATVGIVHVVDHDKTPRRRMYEAIARRMGVAPPPWAEPPPPDGVPRGKRVANERLHAWLGVRLRHPTHTP